MDKIDFINAKSSPLVLMFINNIELEFVFLQKTQMSLPLFGVILYCTFSEHLY